MKKALVLGILLFSIIGNIGFVYSDNSDEDIMVNTLMQLIPENIDCKKSDIINCYEYVVNKIESMRYSSNLEKDKVTGVELLEVVRDTDEMSDEDKLYFKEILRSFIYRGFSDTQDEEALLIHNKLMLENKIGVIKNKAQIFKQGVLSRKNLNKSIRNKKYISQIDMIVSKLSISKLEKLLVKIEKIPLSTRETTKYKDIIDYLESKILLRLLEEVTEYYIKDGKIFDTNSRHITHSFPNIGICEKPGSKHASVDSIVGFSEEYLIANLNTGVCEGGGGISIYIFNLDNLEYIHIQDIRDNLESEFNIDPVLQFLSINGDILSLRLYDYQQSPSPHYNQTITDSNKSIDDVINSRSNALDFVQQIDISLNNYFIKK